MEDIQHTERASKVLQMAMEYCCNDGYEFVTPEHLLEAMMRDDDIFVHVLANFARTDVMLNELIMQIDEGGRMPAGIDYEPVASAQLEQVVEYAYQQVVNN